MKEDRAGRAIGDGSVEGSADSQRERDQGGLVALAVHSEHTVTASLPEGLDVRAGRLEHAEAEQSEHRHEYEAVGVGGVAASGEDRLELKVAETERW